MKPHITFTIIITVCILLALILPHTNQSTDTQDQQQNEEQMAKQQSAQKPTISQEKTQIATFAAGCFWCVEAAFQKYKGVLQVISGYAGGEEENPSYKQVSSGSTGHVEAVQITFDPTVITYSDLMEIFWRQFNPTDKGGSFGDRGFQYSSAVFYHTDEQKKIAEKTKKTYQKKFTDPIVTRIVPFTTFFEAEGYHQDYYKKNPVRYRVYRYASGRDQYRENTWGNDKDYNLTKAQQERTTKNTKATPTNKKGPVFVKPTDEELQKMLTPLQYKVTQKDGTERAFNNEYWDNTEEGIYVDIVSGEPLFSSVDKYKSGTGWPSFTKPINEENIITKTDYKIILPRTEVRSKLADSHLGHVFNDGPEPTGKRYCMNSAALRFVPKKDLKKEGYEEYMGLFE